MIEITMELRIGDDLEVAARRLPYAVSDALNDVAFRVRKTAWIPELRERLTLRNRFTVKGLRPGTAGPGGIGIQRSKPRVLMARLFTGEGAGYLELQEAGGVKRARSRPLAIPSPRSPDLNARGYVRRKWPGRLRVDQPGSRVFTLRDRVVRRERGGRTLSTLFTLRQTVRVADRVDLRERGQMVASQEFSAAFARRWARELRYARR